MDLTGLRSMVDLGSYAVVQVGGDQWSGRSGRALSTLPVDRMSTTSPMWLLLLLGGVGSADDQGVDEVDGESWRHLSVTVSLADASAAVPGGMPSPVRDRFEDLLALPVEIWWDATHLRRLRFTSDDSFSRTVTTVTLSDFGVDVEGLDWSRLPTFRSPEEAEVVRRRS